MTGLERRRHRDVLEKWPYLFTTFLDSRSSQSKWGMLLDCFVYVESTRKRHAIHCACAVDSCKQSSPCNPNKSVQLQLDVALCLSKGRGQTATLFYSLRCGGNLYQIWLPLRPVSPCSQYFDWKQMANSGSAWCLLLYPPHHTTHPCPSTW